MLPKITWPKPDIFHQYKLSINDNSHNYVISTKYCKALQKISVFQVMLEKN